MKKRLTALFLAFALVFVLLPAAVLTASAETCSGTCGAEGDGSNLTWTLDTETGVLEITGTGEMDDWLGHDDIYAPWYSYQDTIKTVNIGSGVTSIGVVAFYDCTALTSVTIPDSVTSIGEAAFCICTGLMSVTIPDGVTSIGRNAFYNTGYYNDASNWTDGVLYIGNYLVKAKTTLEGAYTVKEGAKLIADDAFRDCTGLTSVTIPDSVTSIGDGAFCDCTGLTSVTIPDGVTSIGDYAFCRCTALTSVTIPDGVTSIGDGAFYDCTGLTSITIPDGVTSIGDYAFYGTGYSNDASNWTDGVLYIENYLINASTSLEGAYTVREGTKLIADSAFSRCTGLTSVTIPDSVTSIGNAAFWGCTGLTSVTIGDRVTSIGEEAFGYYWDSGTHRYEKIDDFTIYGHDGSAAQTYAEENGFAFVDLGDVPPNIYSGTCGAEGDGSNLTWTLDTETGVLEITGTGEMDDWSEIVGIYAPWESYRDTIKTVIIGSGVTSIGDYAIAFCAELTSVTIGNGVTSIGVRAFYNCAGLTSVTIPDGVTSIGVWAFCGCTGLTSVTIPDGVTSIGDGAFCNCTGLTSVTIGNSVTSIGEFAFCDCTGLTSIMIPDSVTSIVAYAFVNTGYYNDASNWTDGVLYIGNYLVEAKKTLEGAYTVKEGAKLIADAAFNGCTGLTSVTIPDSVTSIGNAAFWGCTGLTSVTIPYSVSQIGRRAFGYYNIGETQKIDGFTIYGYNGSAAQVYAEENGFTFVSLGDVPECGHEHAHPEHKDAACTEAGYDRMICDGCGKVISETVIPALGHTYKDGVCTVCGAKDPDYKPVEPTKFNDVKESAWYYDAVNYAVTNGLMNGVGNGNFAPDDPMTRAMLVTVLWRYEGEKKEGTNSFIDVPDGQWYTDAVAWAAANGIVGGVGNGKFDPNGNITREQMAAILYRYAQGKNFDTTARGDLSKFPDASKVSDWAKDAIAWAVGEGIIGGSDGKLLPQGNATRAQVSTILMRFIENAKEATPYDTQGHTYEFVRGMYSWEEAQKTAKEKGGYLVRFDSEDEFKYVVAEIAKKGYQDTNFIIGARRADGSKDYYFVDADDKPVGGKLNAVSSWTTAYWASGEPTYEWDGEQEWIVAVEYKAAEAKWTLNDIPDSAAYPTDPNCHGFIIEHEP